MIVQKDIITLSMLKITLIVKAGAPTNHLTSYLARKD
jgi:hypothetical protein